MAFDIKAAQAEAEKEIAEEAMKAAKGKIKAHLQKIEAAKKVLVNLENEYAILLREVAGE